MGLDWFFGWLFLAPIPLKCCRSAREFDRSSIVGFCSCDFLPALKNQGIVFSLNICGVRLEFAEIQEWRFVELRDGWHVILFVLP
jgi:hypothetical protein